MALFALTPKKKINFIDDHSKNEFDLPQAFPFFSKILSKLLCATKRVARLLSKHLWLMCDVRRSGRANKYDVAA